MKTHQAVVQLSGIVVLSAIFVSISKSDGPDTKAVPIEGVVRNQRTGTGSEQFNTALRCDLDLEIMLLSVAPGAADSTAPTGWWSRLGMPATDICSDDFPNAPVDVAVKKLLLSWPEPTIDLELMSLRLVPVVREQFDGALILGKPGGR